MCYVPKTPSSPAIGKAPVRKPVRIAEPTLTTFINDDKIEILEKMLSMGNRPTAACAVAGVNYDLFRRWMARGGFPLSGTTTKDTISPEDAEEPYYSFAMRMKAAAAEAEVRAVNQIVTAGDRDWKAAAWLLEKSNPDEWAPEKKQSGIQIDAKSGVQIFLPDNGRGDNKDKEIIEGEFTDRDD
jgi:hypothetical protein